jgi:hypothetical protein
MFRKIKNTTAAVHYHVIALLLLAALQFSVTAAFAQDAKTATLKLSFPVTDSVKTCTATITRDSAGTVLPVKEVEIHFYVKGMYALLPVGKLVSTDENGEATIDFPKDMPGDKNNTITMVAKVEKDATYGSIETTAQVKWGVQAKNESYNWSNRSLSASRERAPMFLVIASSLIIMIIWGTIFYVVFQLFKIKKSARQIKKTAVA